MSIDAYPTSVNDVLDDNLQFHPAVLEAVRSFARAQPWKGSIEQRKKKFKILNRQLAVALSIPQPDLTFDNLDGNSSGMSHYIPSRHRIVLVGKLSVVTFLHEWGHARGMGERDACRWSINLFRRCFPRQYARLVHQGHMLVAPVCR